MAYVKVLVKKSSGRKPLTAEQKIESKARAHARQILYDARPEIIAKRLARKKAAYDRGAIYTKVLVKKKSGRKALTEAEREQRALAKHELIATKRQRKPKKRPRRAKQAPRLYVNTYVKLTTTYAPGLRAQINRVGDSDVDRGMSADNRLKYNLGNGGRQIIPNRPAY